MKTLTQYHYDCVDDALSSLIQGDCLSAHINRLAENDRHFKSTCDHFGSVDDCVTFIKSYSTRKRIIVAKIHCEVLDFELDMDSSIEEDDAEAIEDAVTEALHDHLREFPDHFNTFIPHYDVVERIGLIAYEDYRARSGSSVK